MALIDMKDVDDKSQVIFAVLILGILVTLTNPPTETIGLLGNIISGLFGIAVGKVLNGGKQ